MENDYDYGYNFCEICGQEINDKKILEIGDGECICRKCRGSYYNYSSPSKKIPIKKKQKEYN